MRAGPAAWRQSPTTVAKWEKREPTADRRTGPSSPRPTVLTVGQEATLVASRKHTLLPLDDCLYALQATIAQLTRSSLHRCLERHGIIRLPGFFHVDLAEVRTAEGKPYLVVALDRTRSPPWSNSSKKPTCKRPWPFWKRL